MHIICAYKRWWSAASWALTMASLAAARWCTQQCAERRVEPSSQRLNVNGTANLHCRFWLILYSSDPIRPIVVSRPQSYQRPATAQSFLTLNEDRRAAQGLWGPAPWARAQMT